MASGSYAKRQEPQEPLEITTRIPPRATRQLPSRTVEESETTTGIYLPRTTVSKTVDFTQTRKGIAPKAKRMQVIDQHKLHLLERYPRALTLLIVCMIVAVLFSAILLSSSIMQRSDGQIVRNYGGGQIYDIKFWQQNEPMPSQVPIKQGPYSVLDKPSLTVDFMNKVMASYNSPATGKAQALYDLGLKYNIDPAFALAFFLHESTMGTQGEARKTLSLGNLRCIPNADCVDQDRGGYASFPTWEAGFEAWYKLIRNYYVAQRGLATVDQIIPIYAPNADNNNEQGYVAALKHYLDTWHAGQLRP